MGIKGSLEPSAQKINTLLFDLDGTLIDMRPRGLRVRFMSRALLRYAGAIPFWKIPTAFSKAMQDLQNNTSSITNYKTFLNTLSSYAKSNPQEIERRTRLLISKDFARFSSSFISRPGAKETVDLGNRLGYKLVLATNPVWPLQAIQFRATWGGIQTDSFDFISHSEIMNRAKPSPEYYEQLLQKIEIPAENCLMIGNDPHKDLPAREAGIRTFLVEKPETEKNWDIICKDPRLNGWGSLFDLQEWMKEHAPNPVPEK